MLQRCGRHLGIVRTSSCVHAASGAHTHSQAGFICQTQSLEQSCQSQWEGGRTWFLGEGFWKSHSVGNSIMDSAQDAAAGEQRKPPLMAQGSHRSWTRGYCLLSYFNSATLLMCITPTLITVWDSLEGSL
ncbi:unnamed protein product [Lepidochelys olivacea]